MLEYRSFVYLSDVLRFKGQVVRKYVDQDGENCLDLETSIVNQRGDNVMPGKATVALPSKQTGVSPLDRRLLAHV